MSRRNALKSMNAKNREELFGLAKTEPNNVITDLADNVKSDEEENTTVQEVISVQDSRSEIKTIEENTSKEEVGIKTNISNDKEISSAEKNGQTELKEKKKKASKNIVDANDIGNVCTTIYVSKRINDEVTAIGELAKDNNLISENGSKLDRAEFIRMALEHEIENFYNEYPKAKDIVQDIIKEKREIENKKKRRML